jgi:hypothetical protein
MEGRAQEPDDFASAFESAFARLQILLETACAKGGPWQGRAIDAIRQALEFAAAEPRAADVLTIGALAQGVDGLERYERLMAYVAGLLESGRAESPHGTELPPTTERSLAGGVATIVANRVQRGREAELPGLTAEVVQFVLTPYLGMEEARRLATRVAWLGGQPDR